MQENGAQGSLCVTDQPIAALKARQGRRFLGQQPRDLTLLNLDLSLADEHAGRRQAMPGTTPQLSCDDTLGSLVMLTTGSDDPTAHGVQGGAVCR